jgi:hypothetical protein
MTARPALILGLALACGVLLAGCAAPRTYAGTLATAAASGCWPGDEPTPLPLTVTPFGGATATPFGARPAAGTHIPTPLPTTTPYPRCTPGPNETARPWPTPLPTRPPFPTRAAVNQPGSTAMQTIMRLPDAVLSVDIAAHPLTGDPVVAAIAAPLTQDGSPHAFVRAYDGRTGIWGATQNVDVGASAIGRHRFRSVAVAASGDGAITVVWGASLPDMGLWASTSRDRGASWDEPQYLAGDTFGVLDVAATLDGRVAVLALGRDPLAPFLVTREAGGSWGAADPIPVGPAWYASAGSVVIAGEGAEAHVVALVSAGKEAPGTVFVASRPLGGGAWSVGSRRLAGAPGDGLVRSVRGVAALVSEPNGESRWIVAFSLTMLSAPDVYALVSNDGGASWADVSRVTAAGEGTFGALAYDAAARRLVALWTCCEDARWGGAASTHYGAWSVPSSGSWEPRERVPLVTGAKAAGDTAAAQATNSRFAWLAWVEDGNSVAARALDLDRVVAGDQYALPMREAQP